MKKLVGLTTIIILFSLTVIAQGKRDGMRQGPEFTSEQMATLQAKKMALHLNLDKNQQNAVYELKKKQADERQKNVDNLSQNRQNRLQLTNDELFKRQNTRLERQIKNKEAMRSILTKEQFSKWENNDTFKMSAGKKRMTNCIGDNKNKIRSRKSKRIRY